MLPISITTAPAGSTISTNYKTIYYHLIGNPIAGLYTWDFTRYDTQDGSGPTYWKFIYRTAGRTGSVGRNYVSVASNYYIQPHYELSFTDSSGVLIKFKVKFNQHRPGKHDMQAVLTVISGPNLMIADPVNGIYEFQYAVLNGSAFRYVIDKYYK